MCKHDFDFVGNWFWLLWSFPFFSLFFCVEQERRPKGLVSNLNGWSLPIPSGLNQVTIVPPPFHFLQQLRTWFIHCLFQRTCFPFLFSLCSFLFWLIFFLFPLFFLLFFSFFFLCGFCSLYVFLLFVLMNITNQKMIETPLGRYPFFLIPG